MPHRLTNGLLLVALLSACAGQPTAEAPAAKTPMDAGDGDAGNGDAACEPDQEVPLQGGSHLLAGQEPPVPYNSTPPTSGWHSSVVPEVRAYGQQDALSEPEQVSILEGGGVVASHGRLTDEQRERLEAAAAAHPGTVAVTPYEALDRGEVAFSAWGVAQRCLGVDGQALDAFVAAHAHDQGQQHHEGYR